MNITLRQLQIFKTVAETQHISNSSEQLYISQSAVSMAISDLERKTGCLLFERRGKRLFLNEKGRSLLPHVNELLSLADSLQQKISDLSEEPMGILRIGASTTIGNYLLPALIGNFVKECPLAEVQLEVGNTGQVEQGVQNGTLDLGLVEGPWHLKTLRGLTWCQDELVVIGGQNYPWVKAGSIGPDMLSQACWIMREKGSGTREVFEKAMMKQVGSFNISLELGHTEAIKKAVEAGLGISCLSRLAVQRELDNGWLFEIKTSLDLKRPLTVLIHEEKYRSKLLESFLDMIRAR